jgi:hypothetical protein
MWCVVGQVIPAVWKALQLFRMLELLAQWHSIMSLRTWVFNNTAVRTKTSIMKSIWPCCTSCATDYHALKVFWAQNKLVWFGLFVHPFSHICRSQNIPPTVNLLLSASNISFISLKEAFTVEELFLKPYCSVVNILF